MVAASQNICLYKKKARIVDADIDYDQGCTDHDHCQKESY